MQRGSSGIGLKRSLLMATVSAGTLLGISGFATAADVQPVVVAQAPAAPLIPPQPAERWGGVYVGGVAAAGMMQYYGPYGYYYTYPEYAIEGNGFSLGALGLTAGLNFQRGAGIFGIEGDLSWSRLGLVVDSPYYTTPDSYYLASVHWNWFATLRARAGIAVNNAMFYATGGLALVNAHYHTCYYEIAATNTCDPSTYDYDFVGNQVGLAWGAGAEIMIRDNASVKFEFLNIRLPDTPLVFNEYYADSYPATFTSAAHLIRVGFNWFLGGR